MILSEVFDQASWKAFWAAVLSCVTWLIGGLDASVLALTVLYVVDFCLGFSLAWTSRTLSARRWAKGLRKSLLYCLVLISAHMLDLAMGKPLPFSIGWARDFMVIFISIGEFLSICAHLAELGVRLPRGLLDRLTSYRDHPERAAGALCGQAYGGIPGVPGQPSQPGQAGQEGPLE